MNNYKLYVFFLFLVLFFSCQIVRSQNLPLLGKKFIIDAGHGGTDPGAIYFNKLEKNINLSISKNLKKILESKGALVYLTRTDDYDLSSININKRKKSDFDNRIKFIEAIKPDLVISVHLNAEPSNKWDGIQIFYSNKKSYIIASEITKKLNCKRKVKEIKDIYLLDNIKYDSVLIEYGFISNYLELQKLMDDNYITNINSLIVDAIETIYKG